MSTLTKLPRWVRAAALAVNLAAALGVLAAYWVASYPNLIAAWAQGSALVTLAPVARSWLERRLAEHHAAVKADVKAHVDRALAAQPPGGGEAQ